MKKLVATTMMDKTIEVVRSNKCPALTSVYFKGMGGGRETFDHRDWGGRLEEDENVKHPPLIIREATRKGFTEIFDGEVFDINYPDSKTRRGRRMTTKANNLLAKTTTDFCQYKNARIRRLTPTECARLQTIPSWYKFRMIDKKGNDVPLSDTAIYKILGNGWCINCITHCFSHLHKEIKEKWEMPICDECWKKMSKGYIINGGMEYFCTDECLHKHYTEEDYLEMYDGGEGESFWTEWDDEEGFENSQAFEPKEEKQK